MKAIILIVSFLWFLPAGVRAFDLEVGVHKSRPQFGYRLQTYKGPNSTLTFKPSGQGTIAGQSQSVGLGFDHLLVELEQTKYRAHILMLDAQGSSTLLYPQYTQSRMGFFYREERELAGFFLGVGLERYSDQFVYAGQEFKNSGDTAYFKVGLELIFSALRVRVDQVDSKLGKYNLKTNSMGVLFRF